ncbi:MAG: ribonuclease III [Desulfatibacillaceae bacterium]
MPDGLEALEHRLGYTFSEPGTLAEAVRHRSFVNENPDLNLTHNERLEFLGDAVLGLSVGRLLMLRFPDMPEGDLSRMRAALVNEQTLAGIARGISLGDHVLLGRGEAQGGGADKNSILADCLEAVFGAIFVDAGYDPADRAIIRLFRPLLADLPTGALGVDYKSRLQEEVQVSLHTKPVYTMVGESGPDHEKTFTVEASVGEHWASGTGKSKKAAEQDAARALLELLERHRT